ncbi:pro-neuregulin-2, membrane-bound isoform [Anabrus simplex]|uniref:pro-neuregulin-2, membrane-bound isoform n=1 Tax=Anabrus simplex TaxID=316456 RepID=UPI0034DDA7BE
MKDKHEVELKNTLRLECRMRGRNRGAGQQYKLRWFKDGVKLDPARNRRIRIKRRRLVITDVKSEDKGEYECRAVSPRCGTVSLKAKVTVKADTYPVPPFPPYFGTKCEANGFCLNGGTCTWIMVIGEMVCHCAEGFKGQRCDHKDALNTAKRRRKCSSSGDAVEHRRRHPGGLCLPQRDSSPRPRAGGRASWRGGPDIPNISDSSGTSSKNDEY